jgi:uncharacterized protein
VVVLEVRQAQIASGERLPGRVVLPVQPSQSCCAANALVSRCATRPTPRTRTSAWSRWIQPSVPLSATSRQCSVPSEQKWAHLHAERIRQDHGGTAFQGARKATGQPIVGSLASTSSDMVVSMSVTKHVEYGEPAVALPNEILRSVVGSGLHGIAIASTDDHDEMGVYIEPPEYVLGIEKHREDYVWRTQPEGTRSGHNDTDLVLYSLRKYLRLAIKGNPTVMLPLFAPEKSLVVVTPLGEELRSLRASLLSQQAVERLLGYMHSQHERMLGQSKRSVPNRPELIEKYGWDVKYGSHALRLAYQGFEIASAGTLTLPLPHQQRERVLSVKRGEVPRDEVSAEIGSLEAEVRSLLDEGRTPLPDAADFRRITAWAVDAQRRHWNW